MRAYFHLPYTQTEEGVVREHDSSTLPSIPDYSNINRRINRLDIIISSDDVDDKSSLHNDDYFIIAIDFAGVKISNLGEWKVNDIFKHIHIFFKVIGSLNREK